MTKAATVLLAALLLALVACTAQHPPEVGAQVLPFIEDDYGKALSEAREKKLPLFVDVWTPW
jgi:hypothetical protein